MPKRGWRQAQANTAEYLQQVPALELLNLLPTAVLGVGLRGEIVYASPAFAEMLGYSDGRAVTRLPLPELLAGHEAVAPSDCLGTLRAAESAVGWNHRQDYVIQTMVSPPLLLRENDTLLLVGVTDVSDLLWNTNRRQDVDSAKLDSMAINRLQWDERAPAHAGSPDYHVERFEQDPDFLSYVVRFDLPRLGDVAGLSGVHLQCHIGTDTISLARLGAHMTGLDFSSVALAEARRIAALAGAEVDFVQADVYDAVSVLGADGFDLVFTGVGALCWLPDVRRWARTVADLLRTGGRLFIREFHPIVWTLEERADDLLVAVDPYFETPEPYVDDDDGTYVATDSMFSHNTAHTWNHGLGEIIGGLLEAGMELTAFEEHRSMPSQLVPGAVARDEHEEWHLRERPDRLPLSYTLQARKASTA